MHEMGIMESTLELAERRARSAGGDCIEVLRMRVGRLTGVVPEALEHAFSALSPGTLAEGAVLEVEYVPGTFLCIGCGGEFEAEAMHAVCPACGEPGLGTKKGAEIELLSLEVG